MVAGGFVAGVKGALIGKVTGLALGVGIIAAAKSQAKSIGERFSIRRTVLGSGPQLRKLLSKRDTIDVRNEKGLTQLEEDFVWLFNDIVEDRS